MLLTTGAGSTVVPSGNPCAGTIINLNSSLTLVQLARAGLYRLQALDFATCRTSNVARTIF